MRKRVHIQLDMFHQDQHHMLRPLESSSLVNQPMSLKRRHSRTVLKPQLTTDERAVVDVDADGGGMSAELEHKGEEKKVGKKAKKAVHHTHI